MKSKLIFQRYKNCHLITLLSDYRINRKFHTVTSEMSCKLCPKKIPIFHEIDDQEGLKIIIWKADSKLRHLRARGLVNINQYLTKNLWTLFHQANMRPGKLATAFPTLRSCLTENDRLTLTDLDKKYREIRSQLWRGWKMHNIWLICFKTFVKRTCVC